MKTAISILISIILLVSCQRPDEKQQLFNCWNSSFKSKGVDLKYELKKFEENLIENGYLTDSTWNSYKKLIDSLSNVKAPLIFRTISMDKFISSSEFAISNCKELKSDDKLLKLSNLTEKAIKASKNQNIGFNFIYKQISSEFNEKDFQSDLYKTWISWVFVSNSVNPNMLKALIPQPDPSTKFAMTIKIDSLLDYYIDGAKIDFAEIESQIKKLEKQHDPRIEVQVDKSVPINKVVEIMNIGKRHGIKLELKTNE